MKRSISNGADIALTVSQAEAWFSLAIIACAVLMTIGTFGGAVWYAASSI